MQRFQIVNTVKIIPPSSSHFLVIHIYKQTPFSSFSQPLPTPPFPPSASLVGLQPSSKLTMDSTATAATTEMSSMTTTTDYGKTAPESGYTARSPPPNFFGTDFALRLLLLASSVSALVVLVTSKQTKQVPTGLPPPYPLTVSRAADFEHSPALIYLVAALAVTALYSILTIVASSLAISNPSPSPKMLFHLIAFDALMAGVMASATGAAGAVAYIGLKGNHHVQWNKICNIYGKFCRHIGSSVAVSLVASVVLVLLVVLSSYSLYRRSR